VQVTRATIFPLLAPAETENRADAVVRDEFCADLAVVYSFGPPFGQRLVTHDDLRKLDLAPRALRRTAFEQLEHLADRAQFHGRPPALMLSFDGLESSLLLSERFWSRMSDVVPGEIVVGVPARDVVIVTGSDSGAGLEKARRAVDRVLFAGDEHPLTQHLLVRRGGAWVPFETAPAAAPPLIPRRGHNPDGPPRQYQDHPSWPEQRVPISAMPVSPVSRPAAPRRQPAPAQSAPVMPAPVMPAAASAGQPLLPAGGARGVPQRGPMPASAPGAGPQGPSVPRRVSQPSPAPMSSAPMSSVPMSSVPMSSVPMSSVPMSSGPLSPSAPLSGGPRPAAGPQPGLAPRPATSGTSFPPAQRPATTSAPRPGSAEMSRPGSAEMSRPGSTDLPRSVAADMPRPGRTSVPRPATSAMPRSAATDLPRPATSEVPVVPRPATSAAPRQAAAPSWSAPTSQPASGGRSVGRSEERWDDPAPARGYRPEPSSGTGGRRRAPEPSPVRPYSAPPFSSSHLASMTSDSLPVVPSAPPAHREPPRALISPLPEPRGSAYPVSAVPASASPQPRRRAAAPQLPSAEYDLVKPLYGPADDYPVSAPSGATRRPEPDSYGRGYGYTGGGRVPDVPASRHAYPEDPRESEPMAPWSRDRDGEGTVSRGRGARESRERTAPSYPGSWGQTPPAPVVPPGRPSWDSRTGARARFAR
jgi:hypothetical protein